MMFSATFPKEARVLAKEYLSLDHIRIRVGRIGSVHANVTQHVRASAERESLYDILTKNRLSLRKKRESAIVYMICC